MRVLTILAGTLFAVLVLMLAGPEKDHIGKIPIPEDVQVQSAQAWFYTTAMCSGGLAKGDWLQHFESQSKAHRSVKTSSKYQYGNRIYVNIKKQVVYYDGRHVLRKVDKGHYSVVCGRV